MSRQITMVFLCVTMIATCVMLYWSVIREGFAANSVVRHITFLNEAEIKVLFAKDTDLYQRNLSSVDLYARGARSNDAYTKMIMNSVKPFTYEEQCILIRACRSADAFFRSMPPFPGVNKEIIAAMPWILARTDDRYENGLPHTRQSVIFMGFVSINASSIFGLISTLIHEKVHIYQKAYPSSVKKYLADMECKVVGRRTEYGHLVRSNPDLDEYVYVCSGRSAPLVFKYTNEYPRSISDVEQEEHSAEEHPYETMAYKIAALYSATLVNQ